MAVAGLLITCGKWVGEEKERRVWNPPDEASGVRPERLGHPRTGEILLLNAFFLLFSSCFGFFFSFFAVTREGFRGEGRA